MALSVLYFSAPWCAPCKRLAPLVDKLQQELADTVTFTKINADEDRDAVETYGIRGIPTLIIRQQDTTVMTLVGEKTEEELRLALASAMDT